MITLSDLRKHLNSLIGHVTFDYKGYSCGIDPFSTTHFEMWYGNSSVTVNTIDEVFNNPLFDGKNLNDIWDDITNIDY